MNKTKIIKLLLVIIWMFTIFCFSNQKADDSTKLSNGVIYKVSSALTNKKLDKKEKERLSIKYTLIVRKLAHFSVYLILGLLVISFISEYDLKRKYLLSLFTCFLYSITDEVHQIFVIGRSCELRDVLIDTIGALLGILIFKKIFDKRKVFK